MVRKNRLIWVAALAALTICAQAGAVPINHVISFGTDGVPNPAVIDITLDTSLMQAGAGQTAGLTVNSVNFLVDVGIAYQERSPNSIFLYGLSSGLSVSSNANDFLLTIFDFGTLAATVDPSVFTQAGQGFLSIDNGGIVSRAAVPEPGTLGLLGLGLLGLGLARRKRA